MVSIILYWIIGGEIASTFDHPELVKLGHCDLIEEIIIGEDKVKKRRRISMNEMTNMHSLVDQILWCSCW